jgi:hypothetical protein
MGPNAELGAAADAPARDEIVNGSKPLGNGRNIARCGADQSLHLPAAVSVKQSFV